MAKKKMVRRKVSYARVCVCLSLCVFVYVLQAFSCVFKVCGGFRVRIANQVVTDSRCRGGIVNIRSDCGGAQPIQPSRSTALWRFRVRTLNSPSDLSQPHADKHNRQIDRIYAQQGIRVYGGDPFELPLRQYMNSMAL